MPYLIMWSYNINCFFLLIVSKESDDLLSRPCKYTSKCYYSYLLLFLLIKTCCNIKHNELLFNVYKNKLYMLT